MLKPISSNQFHLVPPTSGKRSPLVGRLFQEIWLNHIEDHSQNGAGLLIEEIEAQRNLITAAVTGGTLFGWYNPLYGSLLLMLFALVTPIAEKAFIKQILNNTASVQLLKTSG
jgi:hypothetical protein